MPTTSSPAECFSATTNNEALSRQRARETDRPADQRVRGIPRNVYVRAGLYFSYTCFDVTRKIIGEFLIFDFAIIGK